MPAELTPETVAALLSPAGQGLRVAAAAALAAAADLAARGRPAPDAVALTTALRRDHPQADPALVSAALTQAELARAARARLGPDADRMLLTRTGLEQATRRAVADRRAARLRAAATVVADLGSGLGGDAVALRAAGLSVIAVERDPGTAAALRANLAAGPEGPSADVVVGDVTDAALLDRVLDRADAALVDPARRALDGPRDARGGRARPERDPTRWSPPWPWVVALAQRLPATCAKVAPGIPRGLAPPGAETEWVSVDGDLVEACVWFPGLATAGVRRRATVLRTSVEPDAGVTAEALTSATDGDDVPPVIGPPSGWLLEPDDAVVRAGLVGDLAAMVDGHLLHPDLPWITTDEAPRSPFGRRYAVREVLPDDARRLRSALRERGIGRLAVKTRGVRVRPEELLTALRLDGAGAAGTLVVTRGPAGGIALLVDRVDGDPD